MVEINFPYRPRKYQKEFETAMFSGKKRAFLLWHRRAGKDIACWNFLVNCALVNRPGVYYYVLPTYTQGKKVIWDGIDERGERVLNHIPAEAIQGKPNVSEMKINLVNGSLIQIVGSEQFDSLRGTNPKGVVLSEYAMCDPRVWSEVLSPIIVKNGGWAVFNTTPLGRNHAYKLWMFAERSDDWYTQKLTIEDTNLISRNQINKELEEGKSEEIILQEYWCSFDRGLDGTFYGRQLAYLRDIGRISNVPWDQHLPVFTAWDLGHKDPTAIVFYQITPGGEVHFIDFYENAAEPLAHYVKVINDKPYIYENHWLPHDAMASELGTGVSRVEVLNKLGLRHEIVKKLGFYDGVEATRAVLSRAWFDQTKCKKLVEHLEGYRKRFNQQLGEFVSAPVHDEHSHGADAIRYASVGIGQASRNWMSEQDCENLYREAYTV